MWEELRAWALERGSALSNSCSPGRGSHRCSLFLIFQSLLIEIWEGTGDGTGGLGHKLQHFHLAGFSVGSRAPQELIARRIAVGHLAVRQVLLLHEIFADEPPGLAKDGVTTPSIHTQRIEEFPDLLLSGTVALREDLAQEKHQETGRGQPRLITQTSLAGEGQLADEGVGVIAGVDFLQLEAKDHLHDLRGSAEDLREVFLVLVDSLQQCCLWDGIRHLVLLQHEQHQRRGLPVQRISAYAVLGYLPSADLRTRPHIKDINSLRRLV